MSNLIMGLIASLHILNCLTVLQQKLFPEIMLFSILKGDFRDEFSHIVENNVFAGRMEVGVERAIHEPNMDLILDYIELLLILLRGYFVKLIRNLSLA